MTVTDTVTAKLAEWEALTEAATEGPWDYYRPHFGYGHHAVFVDRGMGATDVASEASEPDAEFIAHARTAMPALLGFVEDVLRLADEADAVARGHFGHRPCEAFARKVLADRMRAALTKRIGGS